MVNDGSRRYLSDGVKADLNVFAVEFEGETVEERGGWIIYYIVLTQPRSGV